MLTGIGYNVDVHISQILCMFDVLAPLAKGNKPSEALARHERPGKEPAARLVSQRRLCAD
jgi:hypothetical protein